MTTTATLSFPTHKQAQTFSTAWAFKTLTGYNMSASRPDGSVTVQVYNVTEEFKTWIEQTIATL